MKCVIEGAARDRRQAAAGRDGDDVPDVRRPTTPLGRVGAQRRLLG